MRYLILCLFVLSFLSCKKEINYTSPTVLQVSSKLSPMDESLELLKLKWEYAGKYKRGELSKEEIKKLDSDIYQRRKELEKMIDKNALNLFKIKEETMIVEYSRLYKN